MMLMRVSSRVFDSAPYEELVEDRDVRESRRDMANRILASALIAFGVLFVVAMMSSIRTNAHSNHSAQIKTHRAWNNDDAASLVDGKEETVTRHHHTIPTALSIVDPDTNLYVNALKNPLYDRLLNVIQQTDPSITKPQNRHGRLLRQYDDLLSSMHKATDPELFLDRTTIGPRDPLTLSWTRGLSREGEPLVTDNHIVSLHCPPTNNVFVEAATVRQIQATSLKHINNNNDDNNHNNIPEDAWFIPEFSIARQTTCQFRLSSETFDSILATSPVLNIPAASRTPTNIHLAFSNEPTQLVVQFVTGEAGTPVAMYGVNSTGNKVTGTTQTYTNTDLCQAPANTTEPGKFVEPGNLHTILLTDLRPDTQYQYKVGLASGQGIVWSDVYTVHSAPVVGDDDKPFSYVVYGDQGCPSNGWGQGGEYVSAMMAREVVMSDESTAAKRMRAIHHFGDLSYAQGAAHIWDEWFHMISAFAPRVPLLIAVGNHEYDHTAGGENGRDPSGVETPHGFMPMWGNFGSDSGGECGVPTARRFLMPNKSEGSNGVFWYSHDFATVHTVVISSEHDLGEGSPQHQWLAADLAAVNRTLTPWLVVESHRPLYESEASFDQNAVGVAMRYEVEDLLFQHRVDVVLGGHYHMYMRTCDGLYRSECHQGGPIHITVGSAGASLDGNPMLEQPWAAHVIQHEYGYGRITVANATAMHFEFVKAGAENDTDAGTVHDDIWILRDR